MLNQVLTLARELRRATKSQKEEQQNLRRRRSMNRPGIASTVWFLAFVGATILLFRQAPGAASRDDDILFAPKNFADSGDQLVGISGTLTGDGVAYKNNTMVVSCEKDRKECFTYSIEQIGHIQIGRIRGPIRSRNGTRTKSSQLRMSATGIAERQRLRFNATSEPRSG
jgi:hypothetical protein